MSIDALIRSCKKLLLTPLFLGFAVPALMVVDTASADSGSGSTPFFGTPTSLPGIFQAEDFDLGGEGVAYHDNTPGNQGGQYRPAEDVDIIASTDSWDGNYVVTSFETGEWMNYTVNVQGSGPYNIEIRAASAMSGSAFHVEIDGVNVTGSVVVPNTGSTSAFQWVGTSGILLTAGQHVLKLVSDQQYFDVNAIRVLPTPTARYEEDAAVYAGTWTRYGPETGTFSGGYILASNASGSTATFTFTGTAVTWIGVKCTICGIATVTIDNRDPNTVNLAGPASSNFISEPVFSVAGLAPGSHTLVINVTGATTSVQAAPFGSHVAVDAFDVTQ